MKPTIFIEYSKFGNYIMFFYTINAGMFLVCSCTVREGERRA